MRLSDDIARCFPRDTECKQQNKCARFDSGILPKGWVRVADFSAWLESGSDCPMRIAAKEGAEA